MLVNNLQQKRHNRQEITYIFKMSDFKPDLFAKWLNDAYDASRFKSFAELGDTVKLSRTTVSSYAAARPQTASNKASRPRRENVIKLAQALNKDVDEALLLAGHAPISRKMPFPPEIEETMQNLSFKVSDADRAEIVKEVSFAYEVALKRLEDRKKREALAGN